MTRRLVSLLSILIAALACLAQSRPTERVIDLTSSDGTHLKGTYYSAGKTGPGVLLLHQCNKDRKIWDSLARQIAASGMNVLTFELRSFGDSGGKPFANLTPREAQAAAQKWPDDVEAAFTYLVSQPGVSRDDIGLGGASCGVNNSLVAARRNPEVKSLVLLAGPTNLAGRNFLRKSNLPVLFGFADDDEFPPSPLQTEWLYAMTPNPGKRLVRYPTGKHGAEIFDVHPEFQGIIRDWFVTTLIQTPGRAPVPKQKPVLSSSVRYLEMIDNPGGAPKVSAMLAEARKKDAQAKLFPEDVVNIMGYEHMAAGDNHGAVDILKLNADAYPNSVNAYDSLSDAYLADGQKDLALANVRRALTMLKTDTTTPQPVRDGIRASCEQKLKQLGAASE
ncbi:MAG: dienelactone hydrolase family protein [Terriglobales bacterium]